MIKPILFNTEMVRALLDGTKTVTRRVVKPQPVWSSCEMRWRWKNVGWWRDGWDPIETITWKNTPYRPGDILYVRETWAVWSPTYGTAPQIIYKADGYSQSYKMKWRPSIHMPREAARIFLRVTDVWVEKLHEFGIEDAKKEGVVPMSRPGGCRCHWVHDGCMEDPCPNRTAYEIERYVEPFVNLWDSNIKKEDRTLYGWGANPFVWVIEFERCEKPEAAP